MIFSPGDRKRQMNGAHKAQKSPAKAGLFVKSERQMTWVNISAMTTTSGTPNNHKMTGIVASVD
jgi:hypothetical protein